MSVSRFFYFKGKCKWAKVFRPDMYGNYSIVLYPDKESLEAIRKLKEEGLMNNINKDDDGYYITLRRPTAKMIRGRMIGFSPPAVLDYNQKDSEGNPIPFAQQLTIGNGSDVVVKVIVYNFSSPTGRKGLGSRLESVMVVNLVPVEVNRDFTKDELKQIEGHEKITEPDPVW